jgi:hypothetical protein
MRIADISTGHGILVEFEEGDSQELVVIAHRIMPEWLALFARKNRDYGSGSAYELGVRGQYSDIHRKMIKLKRAMWDGEQLDFEDTDEIIKDLISHLFLTLHMFGLQREADQAYVYNEDDAAVDSFFRMVGGNPEDALKMSGVLQAPFKGMVRERAHEILAKEQEEHAAAAYEPDMVAEEAPVVFRDVRRIPIDEAVREHAREGGRTARRRIREDAWAARRMADESDKQPAGVRVDVAADGCGGHGFRLHEPKVKHATEQPDFAFERDGESYSAELKASPPQDEHDRQARYYLGSTSADRDPLIVVPKALLDEAIQNRLVLNEKEKAALDALVSLAYGNEA